MKINHKGRLGCSEQLSHMVLLAEGTAREKAMRTGCVWLVEGRTSGPVWLGCRDAGKAAGDAVRGTVPTAPWTFQSDCVQTNMWGNHADR